MFVIMLVYIGAMLDLSGRCQPVLVHLGTIPDYYRVKGATSSTSYSRKRGYKVKKCCFGHIFAYGCESRHCYRSKGVLTCSLSMYLSLLSNLVAKKCL